MFGFVSIPIVACVLTVSLYGQVRPNAIATYPVFLHEQLTPACELIQPVTFVQYKGYDALELADTTDEIYSPELGKGDFVSLSSALPKKVTKSAQESGFSVRPELTGVSGLSAKPITDGSSCPDLQQAISDANHQRYERRIGLQASLHKLGADVTPPEPSRRVQPADKDASQSGAKPKVKHGMVVLATAIDAEGRVRELKVVRPLDPVLDQRAVDAVRQWQFSPARMKGLPVPVQIDVTVNFNLD